jgi:hypothetical protein
MKERIKPMVRTPLTIAQVAIKRDKPKTLLLPLDAVLDTLFASLNEESSDS